MADHIDEELAELTARPSLRDRAKEAERQRLLAIRAEQDDEYAGLVDEAYKVMRDVLLMTEGEIAEAESSFSRLMHDSDRVKVEWRVSGYHLRIRNEVKKHTFTSGGKTQEIPYLSPIYEFKPVRTNNWTKFTELADLGRPFGVTI